MKKNGNNSFVSKYKGKKNLCTKFRITSAGLFRVMHVSLHWSERYPTLHDHCSMSNPVRKTHHKKHKINLRRT